MNLNLIHSKIKMVLCDTYSSTKPTIALCTFSIILFNKNLVINCLKKKLKIKLR